MALVTYNSASVVGPLLEALPDAMSGVASWQLVVADNDSTDDTLELVTRIRPEATVVRMGRNAGYSAGINAAVAAGGAADAVLVTNPDIEPPTGSVRRLAEVLARHLDVGIVVPRLRDPAGRVSHSIFRRPSLPRLLGEALIGAGRAGRLSWASEVVTKPSSYEQPGVVDWASGAFLLISRSCWDACGGWDEEFFLYSEETEYALRAADLGFKVWFEPSAEVMHLGGESRISARLYTILTMNRVRLFARRNGPIATRAFAVLLVVKEVIRGASPVHRSALRALLKPSARPAEVSDVRVWTSARR